jgi:hypothetical protein
MDEEKTPMGQKELHRWHLMKRVREGKIASKDLPSPSAIPHAGSVCVHHDALRHGMPIQNLRGVSHPVSHISDDIHEC